MKCEDCIHYNVCYKKPIHENGDDLVVMGGCTDFQDKSLIDNDELLQWLFASIDETIDGV